MIEIEADIAKLAREMQADEPGLSDADAHALARVIILDLLRLACEQNSPGARKHFKPAYTA